MKKNLQKKRVKRERLSVVKVQQKSHELESAQKSIEAWDVSKTAPGEMEK